MPPANSPRPADDSHPVWCTAERCAWEWSIGEWHREHCQQLGTVQLNGYGNDRAITVAIWQTMTAELVADGRELVTSVWPLEIRLDGDPDEPMTSTQAFGVARLLEMAASVVEASPPWKPELTVTL